MPDDKKIKADSIDSLKRQALGAVKPNNPLLAYLQYFRGRESEYSFGQFKQDVRAQVAAAKTPEPKKSETAKS